MKGFSLVETVVVLLIIAVLAAVALPYYYNAVENARLTELVVLWGQQKNWVHGHAMDQQQAERVTKRLQEGKLKYYIGRVVCRGEETGTCWEAEFTQTTENPHAQYIITTTDNFARLACIGTNGAGENFCQSQALDDTPFDLEGQEAYYIR